MTPNSSLREVAPLLHATLLLEALQGKTLGSWSLPAALRMPAALLQGIASHSGGGSGLPPATSGQL